MSPVKPVYPHQARPPEADGLQEPGLTLVPPDLEEASAEKLQADSELARRCVAGEVAAWEELYNQCHDGLTASVKMLLSGRSDDANLVDEITARVWYALVADDGKLLTRYDPRRGARLVTFMRAIAQDILRRHVRSERRRLKWETKATRDRPKHHAADVDRVDNSLNEFLGSLGTDDRQFCEEHLLNPVAQSNGDQDGVLSRASFWHKTRRIYKRFLRFFGDGT